ncbi:MAG: VCBS repeat-containing protein [Anaerolineales bacterium]|nr:VCBS repeat-containing protein [Anaerolineales bacterium]
MQKYFRIPQALAAGGLALALLWLGLSSHSPVASALNLAPHFQAISVFPQSNALHVALTSPVSATFDADIQANTISTRTFVLHGAYTGRYEGAFSFPSSDVLSFNPAAPFKPGEQIYATASYSIENSSGVTLSAYTWGFTAAVAPAQAAFVNHPVSPTITIGRCYGIALGDLDGDGDLDAVIVHIYDHGHSVWFNNGGGEFSPHPSTPTFGGGHGRSVALGDLDGDGDLDAMVTDFVGPRTVWLNDGLGNLIAAGSFGDGESMGMALGDIDRDGDLDAVIANMGLGETVWLNDGGGGFSPHPGTPTFGQFWSYAVALGDLDGDGDLDAVVANAYEKPQETTWLNDGYGNFSQHPTTPVFGGGDSIDVALGDLDGDGDLDAIVANAYDQAQTAWLNDGMGNFSQHPTTAAFGSGNSIAVALGDLDGDGDLDAVVANAESDQPETIWLNDGGGNFSPGSYTPSFGAWESNDIALGDLDGDGDLDAVVANGHYDQEVFSEQPQTVWLNHLYRLFFPIVGR